MRLVRPLQPCGAGVSAGIDMDRMTLGSWSPSFLRLLQPENELHRFVHGSLFLWCEPANVLVEPIQVDGT